MPDNNLPMVVVLAGGLGTRLGEHASHQPKALVEVAGEPFLVHLLRLARDQGIRQALICVGHMSEQVVNVIGDGRSLDIHVQYSYDGSRLRGTAGALKGAETLMSDDFILMNGDTYLPCDLHEIYHAFRQSGKVGLMVVNHNRGRHEPSNVHFEDGRIKSYNKRERKPEMEHVDCGVAVLSRVLLDRIPSEGSSDLGLLYQRLVEHGELAAYEVDQRYFEIGTADSLAEARVRLSNLTATGSGAGDPGRENRVRRL